MYLLCGHDFVVNIEQRNIVLSNQKKGSIILLFRTAKPNGNPNITHLQIKNSSVLKEKYIMMGKKVSVMHICVCALCMNVKRANL